MNNSVNNRCPLLRQCCVPLSYALTNNTGTSLPVNRRLFSVTRPPEDRLIEPLGRHGCKAPMIAQLVLILVLPQCNRETIRQKYET